VRPQRGITLRHATALCIAGLLACATALPAQTATGSAEPERLAEAGWTVPPLESIRVEGLDGPMQPMALADVVLVTLAQNLDIRIALAGRSIAAEEVLAAYGIYDPLVAASATRTRTDPPRDGSSDTDGTNVEASVTQLLPPGTRVSLFARDNKTDIESGGGAGTAGTTGLFNPTYGQSVGVEVVQPLLKNFGPLVTNAGIEIAGLELESANFAYAGEIQARLAAVMRAYWELVFRLEDLRARLVGLEAARELARVNQSRVEVGTVPRLALLQAEAQVALREAEVIEREAEVIRAQDTLLSLMNWDRAEGLVAWDRPILPVDALQFPRAATLDDDEMIRMALANRPDYQQALRSLDIAGINRDVARRQRLPELNAFGRYSLEGEDDSRSGAGDDITDGDHGNYSAGVELRYPLFNREARARYRQALDGADRAALALENLEVLITTEVRQATRDVRTAIKRIEARRRQVVAETEKVDAERKRQVVGESTTSDVLDFQNDLVDSLANQARAQSDYEIALIDLAVSTGVLLEYQGVAVAGIERPSGWALFSEPESPEAVPVDGAPGLDALVQ
jgi:outer membrane protein TolC